VGTTSAVALAVKLAVSRTRTLGFSGRAPTLRRERSHGTVQLVNFQRVISGVTGREPGFTVNLNVVPGALRRAWAATGHSFGRRTIRSGFNVGVAARLSHLIHGRDVWWHPWCSGSSTRWWPLVRNERLDVLAANQLGEAF